MDHPFTNIHHQRSFLSSCCCSSHLKGEDLLSKYNFGTSPDLLFRPCDVGTQASDEVSEEDLDGLLSTGMSCTPFTHPRTPPLQILYLVPYQCTLLSSPVNTQFIITSYQYTFEHTHIFANIPFDYPLISSRSELLHRWRWTFIRI